MMRPYPICCTHPGCDRLAAYKIAARWSDGITQELKTYALCCAECLPEVFRESQAKQAACRVAPGETLEPPGIFELRRGTRDRELARSALLEETHRTPRSKP